MPTPVFLALAAMALCLVLVLLAVWMYRRHLDRAENWDPWADTAMLPVVVPDSGRHRFDEVTSPFRLACWD